MSQGPSDVLWEGLNQPLLAVKGHGATSQGTWVALRSWKRQETDGPLEAVERIQPCQHLEFCPVRPI